MTLAIQMPEIEPLLKTTDMAFVSFAAQSLLAHNICSASFNAVSGAPLSASLKDKIYTLSFDRQPFIRAALEVFTFYDHSKEVSLALREKFIIAFAKDKLRHLQGASAGSTYRQLHEDTMARVTGQMKSIGSLLWTPDAPVRAKNGFTP